MSQLRKSASFRSRIPVRRSRLPQRRCCSPPPGGIRLRGASSGCGRSSTSTGGIRGLQTNRSFAFEGGHIGNSNSNSNNNINSSSTQHQRYLSSSSFSSSDESYESEAPHQKFIKQSHKIPDDNSMYISTDAISLDGLLDSVSSGSFSSPPSPVQYQNTKMPLSHSSSYESLDKYNVALETFKLSDNIHHIPYQLAPSNYYNFDSKHNNNNSTTKLDAIRDDIKKSYYDEKQKQLSDWYYIKNVPKGQVIEQPLAVTSTDRQQSNGSIGIEYHQLSTNDALGSTVALTPLSSHREASSQSFTASTSTATTTNTTGNTNIASSTSTVTGTTCAAHPMMMMVKTMNWNNFGCQDASGANDADNDDDHDDIVVRKTDNSNEDKSQGWQACRQFRGNSNVNLNKSTIEDASRRDNEDDGIHQYDNVTIGNCPSNLNNRSPFSAPYSGNYNQENCLEHGCNCSSNMSSNSNSSNVRNRFDDDFSRTKFNSTSNIGAVGSNVNVNLLKQHYQQQQQLKQQQHNNYYRSHYPSQMGSNEYVNGSFQRRIEGNYPKTNGYREVYKNNNNNNDSSNSNGKNNVELQLEHWENISNINRSGSSTKRSAMRSGIGLESGSGNGSSRGSHAHKAKPTTSHYNNNNNSNGNGNPTTNTNSSCSSGSSVGCSSNSYNKKPNMTASIHPCPSHQEKLQHNPADLFDAAGHQQQQKQQQQQQMLLNEKQRQLMVDGKASILPHSHPNNHHHHHNHHYQNQHHYQQQKQQQQHQHASASTSALVAPCSMSASSIQLLPPNQNRTRHQQQLQQNQAAPAVHSGTNNNIVISNASAAVTPVLSARLTVVATPRAALRSRLIQKRSDETSCSSSFEQLNVIGIPTTMNTTTTADVEYKQAQYQYQPHYQQPYNALPEPHPQELLSHNPHQHRHQGSDIREIYEENLGQAIRPTRTTTTTTTTTQSNNDGHILDGELLVEKDCSIPNGPAIILDSVETRRRPLPEIPLEEDQVKIFPPKTSSCRSDCELSGSYASLECPSPPGPPVCLPESRRDPQARLSTYLRTFYTDLSLKEPIIPPWAIPVAPGALCPARLEPELRLHSQSHGFNDTLTVDQVLISLQTKEGTFLEAPRRVLIECPTWASRSNLSLRILHAWAKEPPWPAKGTPVALALFIPLSEAKRSFSSYVEKDLLPKGPLNPFASGFGGFTAAWNSLEALGPKLLVILDGYDNQKSGTPKRKGKQYSADVHDLLDGKLFPEARVIITTSSTNCTELLPIIQRHITYEGLTWGRSASLLGGGQWGGPSRLLNTVQTCANLRKAVRTPLGCLAIAAIYEATAGDLPSEELDVVESILNCVAPETSANNVAELGRLALFCLKMKRTCITMAEIRMYCSCPESNIMGCLDKSLLLGKSAKKKGEYVYNPMCPGMMEFLAANYIASLVNRPGLLAAEITGLSIGDELDADLLKVIKFAMGLLGDRAYVLLSRLTPLWLTPQIVFSLALAGGSTEDNLAALCDILGISKHPPISPLEAKPLWVQVRSVPTDLMGWGMALKSPTCTLKNLELIYQLEKHNILDSRNAIEVFLDSILINESVSTLRVSSLIETEVKDCEISYLANCVSKLLMKPRLENFELVLTLLEEDPPILKLQSVVAALCRTIPRQPKLSFLLLDLGLSTSQLAQLCACLEKCPNVTRLSLPHLRCERGAISALSSLMNARPFSFLSLPSCWGARDDPPSSSGVSMGSGSGSSTGTSGLIKQGSLPGVPSPRSYAPGIFSSLPRGVFVPPTTLGRSATLPRQPLEQSVDKRSCDSVVSKTWYPTPACDGGPHNSGTLHDLLLAARESYSKLHGLDLSKAQLSLEDSMCLGETVRLSNTLHTLKLEGSSRLSEILPSVLGASESPCLQMLSIGSPRLSLEDSAIAMCARALTSCSTLRLLSLDGWNFRIENPSTLSIMRAFLSLTSIRELSLANCRLQIGLIRSDTKVSKAFECRSVVVLKLAGAQVTVADATIMRGPQLLPYIGGFPCLRELDLSAPARSGLGSTHSSPLILDDKCIIGFFQHLHTHFGLLNTLKICNWVVHFDDVSRTLKTISKCIRNSPISHLKVDGISVLDRPRKHRIESYFIHCFISSLPLLRWMGISLSGKKEDQITAIGNAVLDLKGYEIDIKLSESTIEHAKLMAQAISLDGKFDIKVSTFGTSSGILIHAEKSGTKSLTRKSKD